MTGDEAVAAMLAARSVAVVGASPRPDSFGARMVAEVLRGPEERRVHFVNPRHSSISGRPCVPRLRDLDEPPDLVLLGVADSRLVDQLAEAASIGARSAVIFGSAHGEHLRERLRRLAEDAGMAVCGVGCMGFVNVAENLRAVGYLEPQEIGAGPVGLVTHSGSVFSTLLRTRRAFGYTVAVSSGQELVTTTADYVQYLLEHTDSTLIALVLEAAREGPRLLAALRCAAERGVQVVLLAVGASARGADMVAAHSGALAGSGATWEALAEASGALLVSDLAELVDTLELLAAGRRPQPGTGIATVHDSGAERTLLVDVADELAAPIAPISEQTVARLAAALDPGLRPENPLDVWGTGARPGELLRECLLAMAGDPAVGVTALAVDLVTEFDGDTSYPDAVLAAAAETDQPVAVLTNLPSAVDLPTAARLRAAGIPVLEGTRSGLRAMSHLLQAGSRPPVLSADIDDARRDRWRDRLDDPAPLTAAESLRLLAEYGVDVVDAMPVADGAAAVAAARALGHPVVLKTDEPAITHKTEVGGVRLGLADDADVAAAYRDLSARLGRRALVTATAPGGVEIAVGIVADASLGPLVLVAAGGVLVELLSDRAVAVPPLDRARARRLVDRLAVRPLLDGRRGAAPADVGALVDTVVAVGSLAVELGDRIAALDVNPVIVGPHRAVAVDALVVRRGPSAASNRPPA